MSVRHRLAAVYASIGMPFESAEDLDPGALQATVERCAVSGIRGHVTDLF